MSASCRSRVRLEVRTTTGGWRRADGADLGHGHRGLGEHLEGEGLELGVGAVDLVEQQHRRARTGVLDGLQQRAAQQVVGGRTGRPRPAGSAGPRPAGCPAAGAGGSTRRAPRRRRCPRSTAAGTAGCPAPGPAPSPPRSSRPRARPRAAAAAAAGRRGTARWPGPGRPGSRRRRGLPPAPRRPGPGTAPPPRPRSRAAWRHGRLRTPSRSGPGSSRRPSGSPRSRTTSSRRRP